MIPVDAYGLVGKGGMGVRDVVAGLRLMRFRDSVRFCSTATETLPADRPFTT